MTDNEIIKSLECHEKRDCLSCPFWQAGCSKALFNMTKGFIINQDKLLNEWRESYFNAYGNGVKETIKALTPLYKTLCVSEGDWLTLLAETAEKLLEGNR